MIAHTCDTINTTMPIPPKWRDSVINCRTCKRNLTVFLANYWFHKASQYLQSNMVLYVAGGFEGDIEDTTWFVSGQSSPQPLPLYRSNAEETDTRLWLHVHHSSATNIYIVSPDTDVYHIGLPLDHGDKHVFIQINTAGSQKRILSLSNLKMNLTNDPDLHFVPFTLLPSIFQTLYVVTGCDYISFFSGIGKSTFMRYFYQYSEFITSGSTVPGTLADCSLADNSFNIGFLAFLRLIGTVYYKKYASAFTNPTPQAHFNSFTQSDSSVKSQHIRWLDDIRNSIYDRTQFENNMIPSIEALYRHWMRACWVIDMWRQAESNEIVLKPLELHGWKVNEGKLAIEWDSDENIEKIQQRVRGLLKGCKCKTGCRTNQCGCRPKGLQCSEGCECKDCINLGLSSDTGEGDMYQLIEEEDWEQGRESEDEQGQELGGQGEDWEQQGERCTEEAESLEEEVDGIMEWVFGSNDTDSIEDCELDVDLA